jgi:hypothetical protein
LIGYSRTLWVLWNQSFLRYGNFGVVLVIGVYLIVLVLIYWAVLPWLTAFAISREPAIIFQIVMGIIALVMAVYILVVVYQRLPEWLAKIRQDLFAMPSVDQVACLNCGHLNGNSQAFCGHCGATLSKPSF